MMTTTITTRYCGGVRSDEVSFFSRPPKSMMMHVIDDCFALCTPGVCRDHTLTYVHIYMHMHVFNEPLVSVAYDAETSVVGLSRLGHSSQDIVRCTLREMAQGAPLVDLGPPLHSLVIPGSITEMEEQALVALARAASPSHTPTL